MSSHTLAGYAGSVGLLLLRSYRLKNHLLALLLPPRNRRQAVCACVCVLSECVRV